VSSIDADSFRAEVDLITATMRDLQTEALSF
jgi:hypothetical protein